MHSSIAGNLMENRNKLLKVAGIVHNHETIKRRTWVVYAFMASKYLKRGTRREAVFAVLTL
jgi:hypothetical protein